MKYFYSLAVFFVILVVSCKGEATDEEKKAQGKEMLRSLAQECKKNEGATDEDVEGVVEDKMPETTVQKCLHSCMQKQFGVSDGTKFLKEGFIQVSSMVVGKDDEKMKIAKEVAEECDGTTNSDRCELSVDIMTCIRDALKKRGVEKP
ncbi:general odorant-binding protein 19d-like [Wyeomyia smithii]|uniref:general odorant-binding protein 19d-like n=1 Tax=Wyeomyia smithii TaxID=174621 RepID=UPI002467BD4B|nr:general odorant-binding protein 19d-like [Wyeomyia smithii]